MDDANPRGGRASSTLRWSVGWWLGMAVASIVLVALAVLRVPGSWLVALLVPFAVSTVVLAAIDIRSRIIPNRIVVPALAVAIVLAVVTGFADGEPMRIVGAVLGALGLFALYLAPALLVPGSVGLGDVKLAAVVGTVLGSLGLQVWVAGVLAGFIVGALIGLVGLILRRMTLRSRVPFAPAMLAGAWMGILIAGIPT